MEGNSNVSHMIPESKEAKLNIKKVDWVKVSIAAVVVIAIIIACYMIFAKPASALKSGDSANMAFTFIVDGKTIVANESTFKVGTIGSQFGIDSSKIDDALLGKKKGDVVTIKLNASEAYGEYDPSLVKVLNTTESMEKFEELNRTVTITSAMFDQAFSETPVLNKTYSPEGAPWDYKVVSFDNSSVVMSQEPEVGKIIPLNEFMYVKVNSVDAAKIVTEKVLNEEGKVVESETGNITIYSDAKNIYFKLAPIVNETIALGTTMGKVLSFNDTSLVFDTNNPYAGKSVELTLEVLDIASSKKTAMVGSAVDIKGAPTLEAFVVSYCPYGLQMEKGILPAYELLNGKANFKIRFIDPMHGQTETDEDNRQMCIREETKQFWPYLQCFVDKGEGSESACMKEVGIDESKINDCMANRAEGYFETDSQIADQYGGVTGSPTTFIDGKEVQIYPRSPQDVLNAVCNAFTDKPSECSQKLDSSNPSAGFGLGTSSSSSAASCGA